MLDPRLNHVVAVSRFGSFTAAAQSIGVTQSAVTKGVADLERQLGYTLFHRTARGAMMTEKGREFIERATRLLHDAQELLEGPFRQGAPYSGVLRIGVCPGSLEWQLIEPIGSFQKRHPRIRFEVIGASFERMIQQLRSGAVDLAFGLDEAFSEWPDVRRFPAGQLLTGLFVRHGHPLTGKAHLTRKDLAEHSFVAPSDSRPYGAMLQSIVEQGSQGGGLHVVDYFPIVQNIVRNSDAIGVISTTYIDSATFKKDFTRLSIDIFPPFQLCCAIRTRWEPSQATRSFITIVRQMLAPD